jgi:hypothetical protein
MDPVICRCTASAAGQGATHAVTSVVRCAHKIVPTTCPQRSQEGGDLDDRVDVSCDLAEGGAGGHDRLVVDLFGEFGLAVASKQAATWI